MNPIERIEFPGSGGDRLAARLDRPSGAVRAFALFAHCFTCSKDLAAASRIARALARRGIAVLRFDFTGLGHSEGEFANTNFSSNVGDLVAAADYLRAAHRAPALLLGHSLGGAAVLMAAERIPEAVAVVTIGAPADPGHLAALFAAHADEIAEQGEAEVELAGRRFRIRRQLLDDIAAQRLEPAVASLRKALLVMHAPLDEVVGIENASRIFQAAKHPKSFVSLDSADHLLRRPADAAYAADVLAAWASRYLPDDAAENAASGVAPDAGDGEVVVETGDGRFDQQIRAGRHNLRADEPRAAGGDDTGPSPYGLLLASLGACTGMTLQLYAARKAWPLERVQVRLRHEKIHARDCENCETQEGRVDHIDREISLTGNLDAAQRAQLLAIADRCPVHRTLHGEASVVTRLLAP